MSQHPKFSSLPLKPKEDRKMSDFPRPRTTPHALRVLRVTKASAMAIDRNIPVEADQEVPVEIWMDTNGFRIMHTLGSIPGTESYYLKAFDNDETAYLVYYPHRIVQFVLKTSARDFVIVSDARKPVELTFESNGDASIFEAMLLQCSPDLYRVMKLVAPNHHCKPAELINVIGKRDYERFYKMRFLLNISPNWTVYIGNVSEPRGETLAQDLVYQRQQLVAMDKLSSLVRERMLTYVEKLRDLADAHDPDLSVDEVIVAYIDHLEAVKMEQLEMKARFTINLERKDKKDKKKSGLKHRFKRTMIVTSRPVRYLFRRLRQ